MEWTGSSDVPADPEGYAVCDSACMKLSTAAYWTSLADREPVPDDGQRTVVVPVPRRNLLTVETLQTLVGSGHGGAPA